jgi:hypothetical protein
MFCKVGFQNNFNGLPRGPGKIKLRPTIKYYLDLKGKERALTDEGKKNFEYFFTGVKVPETLVIESMHIFGSGDSKVPVATVQIKEGCFRKILYRLFFV